jgi:hypothetical protein
MSMSIDRPFQMRIEMIEADDHIPSMKIQTSVEVRQFGQLLRYDSAVWFDCASWDSFIKKLSINPLNMAELEDMGRHFHLKIEATDGAAKIHWNATRTTPLGAKCAAFFEAPIDSDTLAHIRQRFSEFPHWW